MRALYLTMLCLSFLSPVLGQGNTDLSANDLVEIKAEARKVVETHLNDLLNSVASSEIGQQGRRLIIVNSFLPGENRIFDQNAIIEDDTSPEYTTSGKGYTDLKVQTYLEKLDLFYTKATDYTIRLSEINVTEVKQGKELPYVQVHFRSHFTGTHRNKLTLKYSPVLRTAEMSAEKIDNQWKVLITGIRYYKGPVQENVVATPPSKVTQTPADPPVKPVVAQTTVQQPKPTETKLQPTAAQTKNTPPDKVAAETATTPQTKPAETKPETTPRSITLKKEREVPPATKSEPAATEAKPAVTKAPEKTEIKKPAENRAVPTPVKPDAALEALQAKAAKYKRQAILIKTGSGLAVAGAVATYFLVNSAYTDYKTGIEKNNSEFQAWWDTKDGSGRTNGQNFGEIDNFKTQPKNIIAFGKPGIYFVGAGVVAAGVLWAVGSGSSRKARDLRNQLKQKKLSVSPQLSGPDRYAGLKIKYSF